ncbi:MAG: prepilin-type N-terminal cleavage/methylation domain-containing protein [Alphaproteobacteria bacterium]
MHNTIKNRTKTTRCQNGFTLIEMSISLIIIGILIAIFFPIYQQYIEEQRRITTEQNVVKAGAFIEEYRKANGAYPCPAPMKIATNLAQYGRAVDCRNPPYDPATLAPGNCSADGICYESAIAGRAIGLTDPNVIVGTIPYRDLQLDEDTSLDGYNNRLLYAVTYSMTDRTTFDFSAGAISVVDENAPRVLPDGSADYVVLSMGKTGTGGFSREGVLKAPCAGGTRDTQNCNPGLDTGAAPANSIYVAALKNTSNTADFFDDIVVYSSPQTISPWKRTDANQENMEALALNNVGVGTATPSKKLFISSSTGATPPPSLRVSGGAGNDGRIFTSQVCDSGGNCFTPENIAGDNAANPADGTPGNGMKCPAGQYMIGIENGAARCKSSLNIDCPSDTAPVLRRINPDGTLDCAPRPQASCPAQSFSQCGAVDALPLSADGTVTTWQPAGDCHEQKYVCTNGTWSAPSDPAHRQGYCTDGILSPATPACTGVAGYTGGTYSTTGGTLCGGAATSTLTTACTCVGLTDTQPCPPCDAGYSNTGPIPDYNRERTCTANVLAATWTSTSTCPDKSTYCTCMTPANTTQLVDIPCPDPTNTQPHPITGYKKEQVWDSATCGWQDTGNIIGSCVCQPGNVKVPVPATCPACDQVPVDGYDEFARDPMTCLAVGAPLPSSVAPSCTVLPHFLREQGTSTADSSTISFSIGDACSCSAFGSISVNCKSPTNVAHTCLCLP